MTKIKVELEGEAYADALTAMNNFTQDILDRFEEIESILDQIASMTGAPPDRDWETPHQGSLL